MRDETVFQTGIGPCSDCPRSGLIVRRDADGHVLTGAPKGKTRAIFHYDGLGRLIQKRHRKVSGVQTAKPKVNYYYDGVRRIQEIDKVPDILSLPPVLLYFLEQDYVYGPGYVDEFVAQIDDNAYSTSD